MYQIKNKIVHVLLVILSLSICISAFGCAKENPPKESHTDQITTTIEAETTEAEPAEISLLDESGKARYRIVRPEKGSDTEVNSAIELNKTLKTLTGAAFTLKDDFILPKES